MGIEKVSYTHDGMIDILIATPSISQGELAAVFGYTPPWISNILSSDAFKERLAQRRGEIVDPVISMSLEERYRALAERSLEVLMQKLSLPANCVSDQLALKAAELGAKTNAIGGFGNPDQVRTAPVDGDARLKALAERLLRLNNRNPEVIEGETIQTVQSALPSPYYQASYENPPNAASG